MEDVDVCFLSPILTKRPGMMLKVLDIIPHSLWTRLRYMWPKPVPTCPLVGIFQVQRTDPARVERNNTQVWHLKD